ncbi:hypothetical protein BPOR_0076g00080 [Botrytis porri]|uniref:Uncharacterized protein n=1 Tax=Botrytis porri TaxID=87229 RepID=A0A4Z1L044_9HELO|nr:hypothetical protein BPOR_0076g00080 [Botrytis porri]
MGLQTFSDVFDYLQQKTSSSIGVKAKGDSIQSGITHASPYLEIQHSEGVSSEILSTLWCYSYQVDTGVGIDLELIPFSRGDMTGSQKLAQTTPEPVRNWIPKTIWPELNSGIFDAASTEQTLQRLQQYGYVQDFSYSLRMLRQEEREELISYKVLPPLDSLQYS